MQISSETLSILSNFATINQNIFIAPGNMIKTKSPASTTVMAIAKVVEEFPTEVSIYELSKLLNVLGLFSEPEVEFSEAHLTVKQNKSSANFTYSNKALIDAIMDYSKDVKRIDPSLSFVLNDDIFKRIQKSAKLFDVEYVNITSVDGVARLVASDAALSKNNANKFTVDIENPEVYNEDISVNLKMDALRFIPGNYEVSISFIEAGGKKRAICRFKNMTLENSELEYIVPADME